MGRLKQKSEILGLDEVKDLRLWKALASEFLGTMILVLFGCGSTLSEKPDIVKVSFTFGCTLTCLIQALDDVSGCHVNPSVTLGMLIARNISVTRSILYVVAQMLGAVAASATLFIITPVSRRYGMGVSHVNPDLTNGQAFGVEVICTFVLILTVFGVTDSRRADVKGPVALAIGLAAIGTHLFGIPYTGASMNPARSFGPALVMGGDAWTQHWIYWVGPLFGSILATLLYTLVFREKKILLAREEAPENNCVDEAELKMMS